jgi:hypothetical protein
VYVPINALETRTSKESFTDTMLALKKKREAEQKQAAAAIQAEASSSHTQESSATNDGKDNVHASTVAASTDHNGESTKIGTVTLQSATTATNTMSQTTGTSSKVSLLGIGGMKKNNAASTTNANNSKKRTPGEIRIQKGKLCWIENVAFVCSSNASFLKSVSFVIVLIFYLHIYIMTCYYRYS